MDLVVFGYENPKLKVLLIKRENKDRHEGEWILPGGFIKIKESAEDAVIRTIKEKIKLTIEIGNINQFHSYSDYKRDNRERVISIAYYALVEIRKDESDKTMWVDVNKIPKLPFDHNKIVEDGLIALKNNIFFNPDGTMPDTFKLLPEKFTLTQVQRLYEVILNVRLDRRNFYNKMTKLGIIEELDETTMTKNNMEAHQFKFNEEKYKELKKTSSGLKFEF